MGKTDTNNSVNLKIISDGTTTGTKLIDENSGEMVHLVQRISWKATSDAFLTKTFIEVLNVPVEIVAKATVFLKKFNESGDLEDAGQVEKLIKIVSSSESSYGARMQKVLIYDAETSAVFAGVSEATVEIDTDGIQVRLTQVMMFDKEAGTKISDVEEADVTIPYDTIVRGNLIDEG